MLVPEAGKVSQRICTLIRCKYLIRIYRIKPLFLILCNAVLHFEIAINTRNIIPTETEKDDSIRKLLKSRPNTILIEEYIENIEELYQLSDVYVFPVEEELNCIDVPLSVLEAASCNLPVVATRYGELKEFEGYDGFEFLEAVTGECLNAAVAKMMRLSKCENRILVMPYDWENAVKELVTME